MAWMVTTLASRLHDPVDMSDFPNKPRVHEIDWSKSDPIVQHFIHDNSFITGNFGPLGSGKTASGVLKAWAYGQAYPGANIAVIRTTWPRLRDTTMEEFFHWFPKGEAGHYEATPHIFHLITGAVHGPNATITNEPAHIMFRALDDQADVENVLSLSLAAAWVDEPQGGLSPVGRTLDHEPGMDHNLFLQLLGRLGRQSGFPGMCWLTGNPPDPSHWVAKEFGYNGHGDPTNPRKDFHLYLSDQKTNRKNLYHNFQPGPDGMCLLCGRPETPEEQRWFAIHQQGDYYEKLEGIFGVGTPLAMRFIQGMWIPFRSLKPFDASTIQYISDVEEPGRPTIADCFNVLAVDPAITKNDEGCRSSITLAGAPRSGIYRMKRIVWRNASDHWSPYELCGKILDWVQEFPVKKLCIEKVAWQSALKDIVTREAKLAGITLPSIDLVPPRGDKLLRAMQWSGPVETGDVLFDPTCRDLIDCMNDVPANKMAWDPIDATGLALQGLPVQHAAKSTLARPADSPERKRVVSYAPRSVPEVPRVTARPLLFPGQTSQRLRQRASGYAVKV